MLMFAVIAPDTFDPAIFIDNEHKINAEILFRGINTNGLLLTDPTGKIEQDIIRNISSLPTSFGQKLQIWMQELLKNKRKRIVKCNEVLFKSYVSASCGSDCEAVVLSCDADALITGKCFIAKHYPQNKIIEISDYVNSSFESERYKFADNFPPIDTIPLSSVDDIFNRIVKFAKWLRIYDKQIGSGKNTTQFRVGLEYVIGKWINNGHFSPTGDIKIYTATTSNCSVTRDNIKNKLHNDLIVPLRNKYNLPISLVMKYDDSSIFHARHIEAQVVIVNIERGLDMFKVRNGFKRNFLKIDNAAYDHLRECRDLPDVFTI